jgi:hypothetical protein
MAKVARGSVHIRVLDGLTSSILYDALHMLSFILKFRYIMRPSLLHIQFVFLCMTIQRRRLHYALLQVNKSVGETETLLFTLQ